MSSLYSSEERSVLLLIDIRAAAIWLPLQIPSHENKSEIEHREGLGFHIITVPSRGTRTKYFWTRNPKIKQKGFDGGGGELMIMHAIVNRPLTSHPYKAGTEHAGFSPDQARTQSPSAKRRSVFGESHEG